MVFIFSIKPGAGYVNIELTDKIPVVLVYKDMNL